MAKSNNTTSTLSLTFAIRNLTGNKEFTFNNQKWFIYHVYNAEKVCIAHNADEEHGNHAYGRKAYTWDYLLRNITDWSDELKARVKDTLIARTSVKVAEPTKKAPKSPKMEDCYNKSDKTSVKKHTSKKNVENCYKISLEKQPKQPKLKVSEPTGAWQCDGTVARSPKNRPWTVVKPTNNGWVIMSKSGIVAFLSKDMKYRSL